MRDKSMKRLYRSNRNVVFGGVCGGIGEYFNIDPVIIRILFVLLTLITAIIPCLVFYFLMLFIIPKH